MIRTSSLRANTGVVLAGLVFFCLAAAWAAAAEKPTIGVLIFRGDRDSERITKAAYLEQLKAEGFGEDKAVYLHEDARGEQPRLQELARKIVAAKPDLIVSISTPVTLALIKETKDIPIVFALVLDPIGAGITQNLKSSGTNVTGTSIHVPTQILLNTLRRVTAFKRLGLLYSLKEKNSVVQFEDAREHERAMKYQVMSESVEKGDQIPGAMQRLAQKGIDSLFVTGSSVVNEHTETVAGLAIERRLPSVTNLDLRVERGILLGVGPNLEDLAKLSGKKAAQVLRGARPADIPIEVAKRYEIIINLKTAKSMDLKMPVDLMQSVNRVIQ